MQLRRARSGSGSVIGQAACTDERERLRRASFSVSALLFVRPFRPVELVEFIEQLEGIFRRLLARSCFQGSVDGGLVRPSLVRRRHGFDNEAV